MVGAKGFEPSTSRSRSHIAAGLSQQCACEASVAEFQNWSVSESRHISARARFLNNTQSQLRPNPDCIVVGENNRHDCGFQRIHSSQEQPVEVPAQRSKRVKPIAQWSLKSV